MIKWVIPYTSSETFIKKRGGGYGGTFDIFQIIIKNLIPPPPPKKIHQRPLLYCHEFILNPNFKRKENCEIMHWVVLKSLFLYFMNRYAKPVFVITMQIFASL